MGPSSGHSSLVVTDAKNYQLNLENSVVHLEFEPTTFGFLVCCSTNCATKIWEQCVGGSLSRWPCYTRRDHVNFQLSLGWNQCSDSGQNLLDHCQCELSSLNKQPLVNHVSFFCQENAYGELEDQVEEMIFRINNLLNIHNMPDRYDSDEESSNLETSEAGAYPSSFSTTDSISYTSDSVYTEDSGYNNRSYEFSPDDGGSGSIGPDTAEGKYSFGSNDWTVRNETPKLGDSGQFLSPIFGGRYFVKASWSTFRPPPPHITPALLQPRNIIQVKPLESKSEKTLEKLKNWSSRQGARRLSMELTDTDSSENLPDFSLLKMETGRDKMPAFTENSFSKRTASLVTLPPKLPSEPKVSPFRQPAPLPTIDEIMKKHRKKNLFKRPRVESLGSDGSSATSSGSNYHCGSLSKNGRCPSLDSGIVKSSEAEDTEGETPVASDNNLSHSNASRTLRTQGKQFGSNSIKYVL